LIGIGQKLEVLGCLIQNIGYKLMPLSFIVYFILRLLEIKWGKKHKSKLVKALWYLAVGISTLDGDVRVDQLIVMMIFFDAFDSFIEYKLEKESS
jgi:hypothetical protein